MKNKNQSAETGLVETIGTGTVDEAVARLTAAIEGHEKLRLIAVVDHSAGAESVGLELAPTVEFFVGNPAAGTPLMHLARSVAIDLPQKLVVTASDEGVLVLHNDPQYVAARHGIDSDTPQLGAMAGALQTLANVAAGIG